MFSAPSGPQWAVLQNAWGVALINMYCTVTLKAALQIIITMSLYCWRQHKNVLSAVHFLSVCALSPSLPSLSLSSQIAEQLMTLAYENGINLFDTAEVYAAGKWVLFTDFPSFIAALFSNVKDLWRFIYGEISKVLSLILAVL